MKKSLLVLLTFLLVLTACGSKTSNKDEKVKLEVAVFEGGFGSEWVKEVAKEYMELNENVEIDIQASPDIHQQLQPKFLSGDVPDLMNPGPSFDIMGVIDNGDVISMNKYMETNAYDSEEKWIDTFEPSQFDLKKGDDIFGVPIVSATGYIWWYNQNLFEELGIDIPKHWDDMEALNKVAKENNISVFSVPGKYPGYAFYGIYLPLVQRIGGTKALESAYNLEEGSWNSDAFLKAAQQIEYMREEGYFSEGSSSFSHMEAQTQLFQNETLFVTAGTWLEGEMQDIIPDDFKLRSVNIPVWNDANEDKDAVPISSGWAGAWYIPTKSKNHDETVEFLKFLSSKEQVKKMVDSRGLGSVVKGTNEAIKSEALRSATEMMSETSHSFYPTSINDTQPELINNITNKFQSLMLGEVSAEEFVNYAETKAQELK